MSIPVASTCRVNQVNLAVKNLNVIHSSLMVYQTKCSGKEFSVLSNNCHDFAEEMFNLASSGPQIEINLDINCIFNHVITYCFDICLMMNISLCSKNLTRLGL